MKKFWIYIINDQKELLMKVIEFIKKILKKEKYNSDTYISYLRKIGVQIGNGCIIYSPTKICISGFWTALISDNAKPKQIMQKQIQPINLSHLIYRLMLQPVFIPKEPGLLKILFTIIFLRA